jgi:hypothetical protein
VRIYISGPMTGYAQLNFPAFTEAAERLRSMGHNVISPHEVIQTIPTWEACMKEDIKQMMQADKVAVLNGWKESKGARIEVWLAEQLGMEIVDAHTLEPIAATAA